MTPDGVRELERHGINVYVETGAGEGASISDDDYRAAGADIVAHRGRRLGSAAGGQGQGTQGGGVRFPALRSHAVHVPAPRRVSRTWPRRCSPPAPPGSPTRPSSLPGGALPLLAPMSEVAGRLAPQIGAHYLDRHNGGRGVLMGGAPGVRPAKVVVLGAGNVGLERGLDRGRDGGRGGADRQEPRSPALGRPDPPRPDHDAGIATAAPSSDR